MRKQQTIRVGQDLIKAMGEALAHAKGRKLPGLRVHKVELAPKDVKRIRERLELSQDEMAVLMGTSASGYRKWEQGQREPNGAAKTLLRVMEREPEAVMRALMV